MSFINTGKRIPIFTQKMLSSYNSGINWSIDFDHQNQEKVDSPIAFNP